MHQTRHAPKEPIRACHILVSRAHDHSGLRQESRALGATISGMRHRCTLRETERGELGYFLCYFKVVAPRALVFRPLVKGNEDSGSEIEPVIIVDLEIRNIACFQINY